MPTSRPRPPAPRPDGRCLVLACPNSPRQRVALATLQFAEAGPAHLGTYWEKIPHESFFMLMSALGIGVGLAMLLPLTPDEQDRRRARAEEHVGPASGSTLPAAGQAHVPWVVNQAVGQQLWQRYVDRLVRLASRKLGDAPKKVADEEDAVLSAFHAFLQGVAEGRFPKLDDRDDLWQVLVMLTERKAIGVTVAEVVRLRSRTLTSSATLQQADHGTAVEVDSQDLEKGP